MSQRTANWIELDERFGDRTDEAGFLTLGLAQLILTFAVWMGAWPEAFGINRASTLAGVLVALFAVAGTLGFYLGLRPFAVESKPGG